MPLKIAIVGGGPAGCLLARLLQQSKEQIDLTVFESEGNLNFRSQGGTLDLHDKTGLAAMKAARLFDQFSKHARYDGEAMKMCDKKLLCYISQSAKEKGSITGRPEIDRPVLREILYNSLDHDTIKWNHKLINVDEDLKLHFANGSIESGFDLIIGADGAFSHARSRLTDVRPYYSGIAGHAFTIPDAENTQPELYKLVNRGSLFAWSDGRSIMPQQMGDGSIHLGTWAVRPENWKETSGYDVHDAKAVKEAVKRDYADWDPRLVSFTQVAEDHVVARDLYMLPVGMKWEHVRGITLVGDAAHLMTPFAGEGVNAAFADSLALSKAIIAAARVTELERQREALDKNLIQFEKEMFVRAKDVQQLTYDMMTMQYFTPGSPRTNIERYIIRATEGEMGWWISRLVVMPLVYAWFAVFKLIW